MRDNVGPVSLFAAAAAVLAGALLASPVLGAVSRTGAFAFLEPWVALSRSEHARLDRGETIVRTLEAKDGQLAVIAATPLDASPDDLLAWMRAIEDLKRSRFVQQIGRFSNPPRVEDLADLTLDDNDLRTIRDCRPGACGMKLTEAEIARLRNAASGPDWQQAIQREFRHVMVDRVSRYQAAGLHALEAPADRTHAAAPAQVFTAILEQSPYLTERLPGVAAWLRGYPKTAGPSVESFFYWSKELYGRGKPVVSITHVAMMRPPAEQGPAVVVAGRQIFATHYINGALSLTMLLREPDQGHAYLVYLNRSQVDVLTGFFGGIARTIVERRLRRDAPEILRGLRARLESGEPPTVQVRRTSSF
ncbi:MAG TPA: hypothetical protein VIL25_05915, partial [Vicinamibacterales bacterium]